LGPLFILSLLFDQTKDFFRRWITYGIGTMFSLAVLSGMTSIVLELTERVATAMWATSAISRMTGTHSQGFSTMAFQQGGVGLMMTLLLISTPMMAAAFFNGPLGSFYSFSQLAGASGAPSQQGPYGQAPGTYGGRYVPQPTQRTSADQPNHGEFGVRGMPPQRNHAQADRSDNNDEIKRRDK
jgi:type IV secretion system protein VirB6